MFTSRLIISLAIILSSSCIWGQETRGFGLGFIVGEPTGISFKGYLGNDRAIAGAVAWRLWRGNALHIHADYLFHKRELIRVSRGSLPLYFGVGGRLRSWTGNSYWHQGRYHEFEGSRLDLGVRFPVGLAYEFDGVPLDIFLEIVPVLDLLPGTAFDVGAGLGLRYWF